jgi:hypothetical protein
MLREIRVKEGRRHIVPFLRVIARLQLASEDSSHLAILQVVFSEMKVSAKEVKKPVPV